MAVRNLTIGRNLILSSDSKNNHNNHNQTDVLFNFSLKVAYDIILKSRQSDVLFPEVEIALIVIYVALMTSGVVSNILVCFVVVRQCARKKMDLQKSRNLYVVNLAVADLALCCICTPFTLISLIQREWTFGSLLCKLVPVVQGTNIIVSAGTITAIALDRYNTIVKSRSSKNVQSRNCSRVVATIVSLWLASLAFSSPLFFYTTTESVTVEDIILYEKCIEKWPSENLRSAFALALALVQFVIPVFVLTAIHLKISSYLKFHIKPLRKPKPEIQIHSPIDPIADEKNSGNGSGNREGKDKDKSKEDDSSKKILLYIRRRESMGSENSNRSFESSQRFSDFSRKNSDSSKASFDSSPRKKSDLSVSFRDNSTDFNGFSFSRFSCKSRLKKSQKRREIRRNRRTTFILSCIALVYAVSWLPMTVYQITSAFFPRSRQKPETIYLIFAFCHIAAMSSSVTNPLLYGWLNTNFRREFASISSSLSNFYVKIIRSEFLSHFRRRTSEAKSNLGRKSKSRSVFV